MPTQWKGQWKRLGWLLAALLLLKIALALIDGRPSVFMGDSGAYLATALHGYIPQDRGFAYGFLLRPLAVWPHSLRLLVLVQSVLSGVAAWLLAFDLVEFFGVRFRWAALLGAACALEPLQLLSERFVLTDTVALFLFAVLITATLGFWRWRNFRWLAAVFVTGIVLIAMRISYLPVVALNVFVLPLVWARTRVIVCLLWIGAGELLLYGYRALNASVSRMPHPAYLYADGFFLLSDVAPIVRASDFPSSIVGRQILNSVQLPLSDPAFREAHLFRTEGLCVTLRRVLDWDDFAANGFARNVALTAIRHHVRGFLALGFHTWGEYFRAPILSALIRRDEGGLRSIDGAFGSEILAALAYDLSTQSFDGIGWRWHRAAVPWYWCLVILPVPMAVLLFVRRFVLLSVYLLLLFLPVIFLSHGAEPRYLIPVAWLVILSFGVLLRFWRKTAFREDLPGSAG